MTNVESDEPSFVELNTNDFLDFLAMKSGLIKIWKI